MSKLRLGHDLDSLRATLQNGPGYRICIWVQGCVHRCTSDCLNPHFLDPSGGFSFLVSEAADAIRECSSVAITNVSGITVLGGEPFEQPEALAELLQSLRVSGLNTMVYSGHTYENLLQQDNPGITSLLDETDVLVDGPFLPNLYEDALAWRGSRNQQIHCLSSEYDQERLNDAYKKQGKGFSIVANAKETWITGLQKKR